jgi:enoyl-CoA hydratase/carnithine racemase
MAGAELSFADGKMLAQKAGGIGTMTFNNPEKRNAVSFAMWEAAVEILADFGADPAVRVVVLAGAGGKAFVSGADVSKFEDERSEVDAVQRYNAATEAIYSGLHRFPKPTIAKIRGFCIGGGLGLAVSCDLRIATEESKFALPAARLGLGYGFAPVKRLTEVVGVPFAKEIFFTARQFTAREAEIMGLVNRVLPESDIDTYVEDYATTIAANAPLTIGTAKYVFQQIVKNPDDRDLEGCAERVRQCFGSRDYGEGRLAFMEKRKPAFTGS